MALAVIEILMVMASIAAFEYKAKIVWIIAAQFIMIAFSFLIFPILVAGFG